MAPKLRLQQCWASFFCFLIIGLACAQPITPNNNTTPGGPPETGPNPVNCNSFSTCWPCAETGVCVWCLASSSCTARADCSFTSYTDCCPTLGACNSCETDARCGFCSDETVTGCMAGTTNGSSDGTCPSDKWNYQTCPTLGDTSGGVILGIVLTIGGFLVILSLVLLFILLRRLFIQRSAQQAIAKYYHRRLQKQTCQLCRDGIAVYKCIPCNLRLCQHCVQLQAHQDHPLEQLNLAQINAGDVQAAERAPLMTSSSDVQPTMSQTGHEDTYTTFAALLNTNSAQQYSSGGRSSTHGDEFICADDHNNLNSKQW